MLLKDARTYQILFLSLFLLIGIGTRDWTLKPGMILVAIVTCLTLQGVMSTIVSLTTHSKINTEFTLLSKPVLINPLSVFQSVASGLITALGLSLLLRADHYSTIVLASVAAILSKFLLRVGEKHVFNPANFGIVTVLLLTSDAWVSPGQWGEESWYAVLFLGTGGLVLRRVGRWDTTIAFLATYVGLEAARNAWLGWTWDVWSHRLMSGSLLMFALFMVTDPRTIPNARIGRVIWAVTIAVLTFILRNQFFVSTAVFWSLFALAPLSIALDAIFPDSRFSWQKEPSPLTQAAPTIHTSLT
ncbi:MAG: Na+-transporting NADH:ubiquinone oxidoreductase, subunit NqrB [Leptolyngbyaceae cyanobacterium CSU_1_3]|nr:Na+-transporting NADH:ubiquinone oxidoreductase, subunit NqrB [Leptolyngbyaceae cyanobacterium CSU_1_3]